MRQLPAPWLAAACKCSIARTDMWQGRAGQGRAGQGRAGQGRAGQGGARA